MTLSYYTKFNEFLGKEVYPFEHKVKPGGIKSDPLKIQFKSKNTSFLEHKTIFLKALRILSKMYTKLS